MVAINSNLTVTRLRFYNAVTNTDNVVHILNSTTLIARSRFIHNTAYIFIQAETRGYSEYIIYNIYSTHTHTSYNVTYKA